MTQSQRYLGRYWALLLVGAVLYTLISGATLVGARSGANTEIYPIFSWDLFSVVPYRTADYGMRVTEVGGEPLTPAQFLEKLTVFDPRYSVGVHMAIQELGAAHGLGDTAGVQALQKMLRENHLGGDARGVRYELVRRWYDPLERHRTGRYIKLKVVELASEPQAQPAGRAW